MYIVEMTEKNLEDVASCYVNSWKSSHAELYPADYVETFTQEKVASYLRRDRGQDRITFIAYDKGNAVGFITIDKDRCEIPRLYILSERQRQGVGTKLIEFGIKQLSSINRVYASIIASNVPGITFFERFGFEFTGEQRTLKNGLLELRYVFRKKR